MMNSVVNMQKSNTPPFLRGTTPLAIGTTMGKSLRQMAEDFKSPPNQKCLST